jgi:hypothetical protein
MNTLTQNSTRKRLVALGSALLLGISLLALPAAPAHAGAAPPVSHWDVVVKGYSNDYRVSLRGGEYTVVRADGNGDIDIEVLDDFGMRVAADYDYDSEPECTIWVPLGGDYTIRIVNRADYDVTYLLVTS